MRGSLLITYDEIDGLGGDNLAITINGGLVKQLYNNSNNLYSYPIYSGDVVNVVFNDMGEKNEFFHSVIRKDFTTDDEGGDNGIKETTIVTGLTTGVTFTATTRNDAYDFLYIVNFTIGECLDMGTGIGFAKSFQSKIQDDLKVVIGGQFGIYNGTSVNNLVRINYNGTIDTGFTMGTGVGGTDLNTRVWVVTLQPDQKILIAGNFQLYNGVSRNNLARLNTNGTLDTGFTVGAGFNDIVYETIVQSDGKIICGGVFTSYSGTSRNRIIRLNTDGTIDTSFNVGSGANGEVNRIVQLSDGKLLVAGGFTLFNGVSVGRFVKLNTDGSIDTTTFTGNTSGFNSAIYNINVLDNNKILVSGAFDRYNNIPNRLLIVRLESDGTFDSTFTPFSAVTTSSGIGRILGQSVQNDGKIIVVGNFITINGQSRPFIARLNSNGTLDSTYNIGTGFVTSGNFLEDIQTYSSNQKSIITGFFTSYNGTTAASLIRLNPDGTEDIC